MRRALVILGFGLVLAVAACELSIGGHITPHADYDGGPSFDGAVLPPYDAGGAPDSHYYPDAYTYTPDAEILPVDGGCTTYYPDGGTIYYPDAFPDAP